MLTHSADKKKQDLLDLISVLDTTNTYKQARAKRYSSTATWLVQSTEFLRWANDDSCNMIYLSGKSMLPGPTPCNIPILTLICRSWIRKDSTGVSLISARTTTLLTQTILVQA